MGTSIVPIHYVINTTVVGAVSASISSSDWSHDTNIDSGSCSLASIANKLQRSYVKLINYWLVSSSSDITHCTE